MGAAENKKLVQDMFSDLSGGNAQAFLDRLADDVRFTIIGTTRFSGTFKGKQELIAKVLRPLTAELAAGLQMAVDNIIAEGDWVVMQGRGKATAKNGKAYNNTYAQVIRVAGGKVTEVTEYLDTELVTSVFGR